MAARDNIEAQYSGKNMDSVSFGSTDIFLEVVKDIWTVFREVIKELDVECDSGIKDSLSWRPTSPDMFESEEEEENEKPVDELPSSPDPGKYPSTSPLSHVLVNKRTETAEANSDTSPKNGKRKKKAMRKTTVEVNLLLYCYASSCIVSLHC